MHTEHENDLLLSASAAGRPGGVGSTGRAIALGATLAFGSCSLAACDEPAERQAPMPSLSTTSPQRDPVEPPDPVTPQLEAEEGSLGRIEVSPGFVPDPIVRRGSTGDGTIDASTLDGRCTGWIPETPHAVVDLHRPFAELALMAAAETDVTLVVVAPDDEVRCVDDEQSHAVLRAPFAAGRHRVWVGAAHPGAAADFALGISELDDTTPASLLH